jgi:hypothetical protein
MCGRRGGMCGAHYWAFPGRHHAEQIILGVEEKADHLVLLRQQTILARFGELALKSEDIDEILTEACRLVGRR